MNQTDTIEYYNRQKEEWGIDEIEQLKNEYIHKELSIMEIGIIHQRTPGAIGYKLKSIKIIRTNRDARGYNDYTKSVLYKNIVDICKKEKDKNKTFRHTNEINKKEEDLINKIKYYKDNMEQLIRIKILENELENITNSIKNEVDIRQLKQREDDIKNERIKYCKENCEKAYDMFIYQYTHNEMMNTLYRTNRNNIISLNIQINSSYMGNCGFRFDYIFNKNDNSLDKYNVTCIINGDSNNSIKGVFDKIQGFITEII
jgi:hypothetical protein